MYQDILLLIGLRLPIHHLLSFILATHHLNIINGYFWTLRLVQDYNRVGGLELYKKYYQYKISPKIIRVQSLISRPSTKRGNLVMVKDTRDKLIFDGQNYISLVRGRGLSINITLFPSNFRFIEEFSIHYFDDLPQFVHLNKKIYFDATPYKTQIEANKSEYLNREANSSFKAWNEEEYLITYSTSNIYRLCLWELSIQEGNIRSLVYYRGCSTY
jgi:hypothetical protein